MRTKRIPVTTCDMRQQYEASKAMTVAGTAIFETRRKHKGLKVTIVSMMAALRRQKRRQSAVTRIATSRAPHLC